MEKYMKELNYDPLSFTASGLRAIFGHVYYIWKVYKQELGAEQALEAYGAVWEGIAAATFAQGAQALGFKEVKDVAALGKIVEFCGFGIPGIYETVENTSDRHVGRIYWCANPAYGPQDCIYDRQEYYRNAEVPLTVHPYLSTMVAEAKKMGLDCDVEVSVPAGRCRDGGASFCQWHLWRAGSPAVEKEADPGTTFIEEDIGAEEPIAFIMRKQGKKVEDLVPGMVINLIFVDLKAWDGLEAKAGKEKALDVYQKLWLTYVPIWVKEARLELGVGTIEGLKELAKVIAYCERKKFVPFQIDSADGKVTLVGEDDPFFEVPTQFLGKNQGATYLEAVALADQRFIDGILEETGMTDKVKVTREKTLTRGDDRNEVILENK